MIRFSVVIPAYQSAGSIVAALKSVQQQTYPVYEIIVVDDAGTDDLNAKLLSSDVPHVLVRHKQNKGVSAARNTGWELASGDYVAFLDSDDQWCASKLDQMASLLSAHAPAALIGHSFSADPCRESGINPDVQRLCVRDFVWRNRFQGSSLICKRSMPFRFEPELRYSEDFDLALQVAAAGLPVYFYPSPLTQLGRPQQSEGGLSARRWHMRSGEMKAYCRLGKSHIGWMFGLPFLLVFSLLKHLRSLLRKT